MEISYCNPLKSDCKSHQSCKTKNNKCKGECASKCCGKACNSGSIVVAVIEKSTKRI